MGSPIDPRARAAHAVSTSACFFSHRPLRVFGCVCRSNANPKQPNNQKIYIPASHSTGKGDARHGGAWHPAGRLRGRIQLVPALDVAQGGSERGRQGHDRRCNDSDIKIASLRRSLPPTPSPQCRAARVAVLRGARCRHYRSTVYDKQKVLQSEGTTIGA